VTFSTSVCACAAALGELALLIAQTGSTSIAVLGTEPIIDVQVSDGCSAVHSSPTRVAARPGR
jgi:hypothetical protein